MNKIYKLLGLILCILVVGCSDDPAEQPIEIPPTPEDVSGIRLSYQLTQKRSQKRGVSFNFQMEEDVTLLAQGVSWSYNWGPAQNGNSIVEAMNKENVCFFPMAWNGNFSAERIRQWKQSHPECEYILAFNEPNLTDQANMTPQAAAAVWPPLKALADELGMKLIAPAMNYGTLANYGDPIKWLDEFFSLVPISDVHGIAIHCYMASPSALKSYVQRFYKYGLPIWMTEFCAWESSVQSATAQARFMAQSVAYLESDPNVAGYAWFIPRGSADENQYPYYALLTKSRPIDLTPLGRLYVNLSSLDRSAKFAIGDVIPAEQYCDSHATQSATAKEWVNYPALQLTTDATGILEISDLFNGQWVEYNITSSDTAERDLWVRYTSPIETTIEIEIGAKTSTFTFEKTGDYNWTTKSLRLTIPEGDNTLRFKVVKGRVNLNWLSVR